MPVLKVYPLATYLYDTGLIERFPRHLLVDFENHNPNFDSTIGIEFKLMEFAYYFLLVLKACRFDLGDVNHT